MQFNDLLKAVNNNDLAEIKRLSENGFDVVSPNPYYHTSPLYEAVRLGYADIAKYFVDNKADVNYCIHTGYSCLMFAASNGNLDIVHYLVDHGADIDYKSPSCGSALTEAINGNRIDVVKYFRGRGAKIEGKYLGENPLQLAERKGYRTIHDLLVIGQEQLSLNSLIHIADVDEQILIA